MRIVIDLDGARHESELGQFSDTATLADLVEAGSGARVGLDEPVYVDERAHVGGDRLAQVALVEGAQVARDPLVRPGPVRGWSVTVAGGLDAGRVHPLVPGRRFLVGRALDADIRLASPRVSRRHATLEVVPDGVLVRDHGSTNTTMVEGTAFRGPHVQQVAVRDLAERGRWRGRAGRDRPAVTPPWAGCVVVGDGTVLVVGGTALVVRRDPVEPLAPQPRRGAGASGTTPFNRPPRPALPETPTELEPPTRTAPGKPAKLSLVAVLAPVLMAAAMVGFTGSWQFAMFALLTPFVALGTHLEQRRRHRREVEQEEGRFRADLDRFRMQVDRAAARHRARLRMTVPDPAAVLRAAALPTVRLWARRAGTGEALALHTGVGDVPWSPSVAARGARLEPEVSGVLRATRLPCAPVAVDLTDAGVVGVVGDREGALAVARSLLAQAAVHCGPADLTVLVCCDAGREEDWAWTTWLPHVRRPGEAGTRFGVGRGPSEALLRGVRRDVEAGAGSPVLLVLDSDVLTQGRDAPARDLLGHGRGREARAGEPVVRVSGIVLAPAPEALPAAVDTVVHVGADAAGVVHDVTRGTAVPGVLLAGLTREAARRCALDLARFDDPELVVPGSALPDRARLTPLLGLDDVTPAAVRRRWAMSAQHRGLDTPIGVGEAGVLTLDLLRDGPHGLVGGTTGSGKSEFLRSLVAGLAARHDPTALSFVLIDFKGGAAFAACERLPHTIGTVSNLDEQLADRALRALEAELRRRQNLFAQAGEGVDNLDAYLATGPAEPLPRLVLVVDEFAMLAKDYPDVLSSLVSVATVGRTLGVHMILATQRPAGVVNDDILANTNLRVALRVQSKEDSANVIGVGEAAAIGRTQQGRAYVKLGQDDLTPVQSALVTGRPESANASLLEVTPLDGAVRTHARGGAAPAEDVPTDLDLLIDAVVGAAAELGLPAPRPVWPEALGERVELAATCEDDPATPEVPVAGGVVGSVVQVGISDDPDRQRRVPAGWDLSRGNLLLLGIPGSGTSTTLASLALTLAARYAPDELDLLVLDLGARELEPLADLPHTVAYVGPGSAAREEHVRFLTYLHHELDRRRADPTRRRRCVVLLDGLASLREQFGDDSAGLALLAGLYAAYADGPDVGLHIACSASRARAVPGPIDEVTTQKWLFRLADAYDYVNAGLERRLAPAPLPGRCVPADTKLQTHVAMPELSWPDAVARVASRWAGSRPKHTVIGRLPSHVTPEELGVVARFDGEPWRLPVGVGEADLEPAWLETYEGEHVLVAGPPRSGRSSLLLALAHSVRAGASTAPGGAPVAVWGVCGRRSPLADAAAAGLLDRAAVGEDELPPLLAAARMHRGPLVLLVDDAERFDDADHGIAGLIGARTSGLLVVAAGRADDLRTAYSHWTRLVRKSRAGVLLQPNVDYDGELLGGPVPRRAPVAMTVGRGYLCVDGGYRLVQCASVAQPVSTHVL